MSALKPPIPFQRKSVQPSKSPACFHIDLDVLDPQQTPANTFAAPDGLTVSQMQEAIRLIRAHLPVYASAFTAYDPEVDPTQATREAGIQFIETFLAG